MALIILSAQRRKEATLSSPLSASFVIDSISFFPPGIIISFPALIQSAAPLAP